MATYNGERFIKQQLDCIYNQTLQPDEVIICDDASLDNTRNIIKEYIEKHNLGGVWKLICNSKKKGYPQNFYYCMGLARGEFVFLADQDDIWEADKIRKMALAMSCETNIKILACKMGLVNAEGGKIRTFIKPNFSKETGKIDRIPLDKVLYKNQWSGMILAYRNEWYNENREKVQNTRLPHDLAITILAGAEGKMFQIDNTLAWHRRHENNVAREEHRIEKMLNKKNKLADINKYKNYLKIILDRKMLENEKDEYILRKKYHQVVMREELLSRGRCLFIIINYMKNQKDIRFFTVLCDLLICMKDYLRK